jgi:hypothetical protein
MRSLFLFLFAGVILVGAALPTEAGAARGSLKRVATVQGFGSVTFKVAFKPGHKAVVVVQGDGDTTLALVVLNHQGHRVGVSSKNADKHVLRWTPDSSEPYQIKVFNRGGVPNRFLLRTN